MNNFRLSETVWAVLKLQICHFSCSILSGFADTDNNVMLVVLYNWLGGGSPWPGELPKNSLFNAKNNS